MHGDQHGYVRFLVGQARGTTVMGRQLAVEPTGSMWTAVVVGALVVGALVTDPTAWCWASSQGSPTR